MLVLANTKDDSIEDKEEKTRELIKRCVAQGQEALTIKTADILDSFRFYTEIHNESELAYCKRNAEAILKYKSNDWEDPIFEELRSWAEKIQ